MKNLFKTCFRRRPGGGPLLNAMIASLLILPWIGGCTKRIYDVVYPTLSDGKYDTEFPYKDCSDQLEEIANIIKRVNHIAYYKGYAFPLEAGVTRDQLSDRKTQDKAVHSSTYHQTASGTATVIYSESRRIAFMTCAHIVYAADTLITYFPDDKGKNTPFIQSASFKIRHNNYIIDIPDGNDMQIIAMDARKDIAIIGKTNHQTDRLIPIFSYPTGEAKKLEWGSFVYVLGFPIGNKMITRGIVSNPKQDPSGSFLVDALFNKGFSGGLVLAIKDGVPNFELVGMAKSVSAHSEYVLRPEKSADEYQYDSSIPYTGSVYVQLKKDINYGITHSLSMEGIRNFIQDNESLFNSKGFYFNTFIGNRRP